MYLQIRSTDAIIHQLLINHMGLDYLSIDYDPNSVPDTISNLVFISIYRSKDFQRIVHEKGINRRIIIQANINDENLISELLLPIIINRLGRSDPNIYLDPIKLNVIIDETIKIVKSRAADLTNSGYGLDNGDFLNSYSSVSGGTLRLEPAYLESESDAIFLIVFGLYFNVDKEGNISEKFEESTNRFRQVARLRNWSNN